MWAQSWSNLFDLVAPYPDVKQVNLTQILIDKEYTPEKMFKVIIILKNILVFILNLSIKVI